MSQMLGVTRTTVTEIARELQTARLIRYTRGRIAILDRMGLEDIACECYHALRRLELQNTPGR
jgi:Mn-dependent DtxR family transcriptional regulator